jgi:para-nitrobenzyl esterase
MRMIVFATALSVLAAPAFAQTSPAPAATPAPKVVAKYTTTDTEIGTLLDGPAAKAILEKHIPGMTTNDQVDMARGMTLKAIQPYSPDAITDAVLAAIDADFAKLKK